MFRRTPARAGHFVRCVVLGLVLTPLAGCGESPPPLAIVEGTVKLDGQPLPGVLVTFVPDESGDHAGARSMGMSDAAGKFTLRTEAQQEGALIGAHRVTVEDLAIYDAPRSEDGTVTALPAARFPPHYADLLKTPLKATVQEGNAPLALELKSH